VPGSPALAAGTGGGPTAPAEFGSDWSDPRTAAPPVDTPPTGSCTTTIVDTQFRDFTPFTGTYTPPAGCSGPWNRVVLRMDGAVAGRQFDRLGSLRIGDVTVFTTSTPEPSPDGIRWSVEKDVTGYAALLRRPQPVWMLIGNVVDDTFTGVLDVQVRLTFYRAEYGFAPAGGPSEMLPLIDPRQQDGGRIGTVTLPRNTERLVAEVYATGSGGGCEEFCYLTAPPSSGYSCPADHGPYRGVQVLVDGDLAGIAMPYPQVYTGGWSNPYLWAVLPAPRAFDIQPVTYDLTPFVGRLTDGLPHTVAVRVAGVPAGQAGWDTPVNVLVWQDSGSTRVTGELVSRTDSPLRADSEVTVTSGEHRVDTDGAHEFRAVGLLHTSHGDVVTTVEQRVANHRVHTWLDGENPDGRRGQPADHRDQADRRGRAAGRGRVRHAAHHAVRHLHR
jgi:Peptide N-acetyl-beta-D-glucosaminyl asparaginase amidase A